MFLGFFLYVVFYSNINCGYKSFPTCFGMIYINCAVENTDHLHIQNIKHSATPEVKNTMY